MGRRVAGKRKNQAPVIDATPNHASSPPTALRTDPRLEVQAETKRPALPGNPWGTLWNHVYLPTPRATGSGSA